MDKESETLATIETHPVQKLIILAYFRGLTNEVHVMTPPLEGYALQSSPNEAAMARVMRDRKSQDQNIVGLPPLSKAKEADVVRPKGAAMMEKDRPRMVMTPRFRRSCERGGDESRKAMCDCKIGIVEREPPPTWSKRR